MAPALQVVTIPVAVVGGAFMLRAWWLQIANGLTSRWQLRSLVILILSTATVAALWGLRLTGVIG